MSAKRRLRATETYSDTLEKTECEKSKCAIF